MRILSATFTSAADSVYSHALSDEMAGSSKNDMLLAGGTDTSSTEKFNGVSWSNAGNLPSGQKLGTLAAGLSASDCIAIQNTIGGAAKYNGSSWTKIDDPPGIQRTLCGPTNNLAVIVNNGFFVYNGASWTTHSYKLLAYSVDMISTGNGSRFTAAGTSDFILRYDGVTQTVFKTTVHTFYFSTKIDTDSMLIIKYYNGTTYPSALASFIDDAFVAGTGTAPTACSSMGGGLTSFMVKNGKVTYLGDITVGLLFLTDIVSGRIYYVDAENGNDTNDGLSPSTAWATLTKAVSTVKVGDRVIIAPGVYRESIIFSTESSVNNPITFEGDTAGKYFGREGVVRWTNLIDDLNPPSSLTAPLTAQTGLTLKRIHIEMITTSQVNHMIYNPLTPYGNEHLKAPFNLEDVTIMGGARWKQEGVFRAKRVLLLPPLRAGEIKGGFAEDLARQNYSNAFVFMQPYRFHFTREEDYAHSGEVRIFAANTTTIRPYEYYGILATASSYTAVLKRNFKALQLFDLKTLWALALNFHHSTYKGEANDTWPEDIFGIPRYRKIPGCFSPVVYSLDFDEYRSEAPSLKFEGGGHYSFLLPLKGSSTVSVWVKFTGADKPRLRIWGPVLGELYVDATGDGTSWEKLTLDVTTNDTCLVSFIFQTLNDTNVAYFSDFEVIKVGV